MLQIFAHGNKYLLSGSFIAVFVSFSCLFNTARVKNTIELERCIKANKILEEAICTENQKEIYGKEI